MITLWYSFYRRGEIDTLDSFPLLPFYKIMSCFCGILKICPLNCFLIIRNLMGLNTFDVLCPVVVIILIDQVVTSLASENSFKLVLESFWHNSCSLSYFPAPWSCQVHLLHFPKTWSCPFLCGALTSLVGNAYYTVTAICTLQCPWLLACLVLLELCGRLGCEMHFFILKENVSWVYIYTSNFICNSQSSTSLILCLTLQLFLLKNLGY